MTLFCKNFASFKEQFMYSLSLRQAVVSQPNSWFKEETVKLKTCKNIIYINSPNCYAGIRIFLGGESSEQSFALSSCINNIHHASSKFPGWNSRRQNTCRIFPNIFSNYVCVCISLTPNSSEIYFQLLVFTLIKAFHIQIASIFIIDN